MTTGEGTTVGDGTPRGGCKSEYCQRKVFFYYGVAIKSGRIHKVRDRAPFWYLPSSWFVENPPPPAPIVLKLPTLEEEEDPKTPTGGRTSTPKGSKQAASPKKGGRGKGKGGGSSPGV